MPDALSREIRNGVIPITGSRFDYDGLMHVAGDARFVLIGDATHARTRASGAHAFMAERIAAGVGNLPLRNVRRLWQKT